MTVASDSDPLYQPIQIGAATVRNRLLSMPHGVPFVKNGLPTPEYARHVRGISRGTAGIFVLGGAAVAENSWLNTRHLRLFDRAIIPALSLLCDAAHGEDTRLICQLGHLGRNMRSWQSFQPIVGPSPIPAPQSAEFPAALSKSGIEELRQHYLRSMHNSTAAGADGVEVHAAQGYLLHQFLSSWSNRRSDEYGGSLRNRMRLLVQILEQIRQTSPGSIIGLKISAGEDFGTGLSWSDTGAVLSELSSQRLFDYVTLCVPQLPSGTFMRDAAYPSGGLRDLSREVKEFVSQPVVVSQRIDTPTIARDILASGDADLVGMARALFADKNWGRKARLGRDQDIRPCIACLHDCRESGSHNDFGCSVNPAFCRYKGTERKHRPGRGDRVAVIGGGPAGCTAALSLASGGTEVVLFEGSGQLGGRLLVAGRAPNRAPWSRYADYLSRQIGGNKLITTLLGVVPARDDIARVQPTFVVAAVGADNVAPAIDLALPAISSDEAIQRMPFTTGDVVLVIDELGTWEAANVVESISLTGGRAIYVTPRERVADRIPEESRVALLRRMVDSRVRCFTSSQVTRTGNTTCIQSEILQVDERFGDISLVVQAGQYVARRGVVDSLSSDFAHVVSIGDCVAPRGLSRAVQEGYLVGDRIGQLSHMSGTGAGSSPMSRGV
jgi:2,4-dienoyl-CoA reductase (NADPH2)